MDRRAQVYRITTMCISRFCLAYRISVTPNTSWDVTSISAMVVLTLFLTWMTILLIFILVETLRLVGQQPGRVETGSSRAAAVARSHAAVDERWPLLVVKCKEGFGECGVCLEEIEQGQVIRQLGCKHVFHGGCIDRWVVQASGRGRAVGCPMCKRRIVDDIGHDQSDGFPVEVVYDEAVVGVAV